MEDLNELTESKSYWCTQLINILAPIVKEKIKSIFNETLVICNETRETLLYLKAFQNALSCIPEWSNTIIQKECDTIMSRGNCSHLKEFITTVHVLQLKIVGNMRVNQKQKSVCIPAPEPEVFIHKMYINVARELWKAAFLFSQEVEPLKRQENEFEIGRIIRAAIYKTIQDGVPADPFVRIFLAEDVEETEEVTIEPMDVPEDSVIQTPELSLMPANGSFANNSLMASAAGPSNSFGQQMESEMFDLAQRDAPIVPNILPNAHPNALNNAHPNALRNAPITLDTSSIQWGNDDVLEMSPRYNEPTLNITPVNNTTSQAPDMFELDIETL